MPPFCYNFECQSLIVQMTAEEFKNKALPFSGKLYPMMFRILKNEEETRDALQDLMLKLWSKRKELNHCSNFDAYVITMAKNYCLDLLKKKRPILSGEKETEKILLNIKSDNEEHETKEKYEYVNRTIEQLPEKLKTVIRLRDIDGFSFEEIEQMTGFEVPYLRVILSRARLKVKQEVEKFYNYEETGKFAP